MTIQLALDYVAFAAERKPILKRAEDALVGYVRYALRHRNDGWETRLAKRASGLVRQQYRADAGKPTSKTLRDAVEEFEDRLIKSLNKIKVDLEHIDAQSRQVAASISSLAIATGTEAAAKDDPDADRLGKVWLSMDDDKVRPAHKDADGQVVPLDGKFDVDGVKMSRPGDVTAPIELWINCRCVLGVDVLPDSVTASSDVAPDTGVEMTIAETLAVEAEEAEEVAVSEEEDPGPAFDDLTVPWHGVLAPEDTMSGDGRKFGKEALRWRDLPLPFAWQKTNMPGHDGSVVVGRIDEIWREDNLVKARGVMLSIPEADEVIGLIAEGGIRGISVDVDDATMQLEDENGGVLEDLEAMLEGRMVQNFTDGRISGATLCAIPAFQEAVVYLGLEDVEPALAASGCPCEAGIEEKTTPLVKEQYTAEQWNEATILDDRLPIYTPDGHLSRHGVRTAAEILEAARETFTDEDFEQASVVLAGAFDALGETAPEAILAAIHDEEEFVKTEDGPGWLTHPVDTERLRRYWTRGKGAAKIRWGIPGDFNRCRAQLAKYIKPQYLSGYCANRHYDALGFWPGRPVSAETVPMAATAPAFSLVAAASKFVPPRALFDNPNLTGPTKLTIKQEGDFMRVYGHVAEWEECHIGFGEKNCTTAPASPTNYSFFNLGSVLTDDGEVNVGHITIDTGHADQYANAAVAAAHYDNTGTVVADITVGDDEHGIWYSGVIRPGVPEEKVYALRAAKISGDWRTVHGEYELVAALGVNVPGFPIPARQLAASGGRQVSLVAAGIVMETTIPDSIDIGKVVEDYLSLRDRRAHMEQLAQRTGRDPKSRMLALKERK